MVNILGPKIDVRSRNMGALKHLANKRLVVPWIFIAKKNTTRSSSSMDYPCHLCTHSWDLFKLQSFKPFSCLILNVTETKIRSLRPFLTRLTNILHLNFRAKNEKLTFVIATCSVWFWRENSNLCTSIFCVSLSYYLAIRLEFSIVEKSTRWSSFVATVEWAVVANDNR